MDSNVSVHNYLESARQSTLECNHGHALDLYLLILQTSNNQETKNLIHTEMCSTWDIWIRVLMILNKKQELFDLYGQICSLFDESHQLHYILAVCLYEMNLPSYSIHIFRKCLRLKPDCPSTLVMFEKNLLRVMSCCDFYILNDSERNTRYDQAIGKTLAGLPASLSGLPVLDLGSGSSLLAMMAARHTKKKREVHACEVSLFMAVVGGDCVRVNGFDGSMLQTFNCHSFDVGNIVGANLRYSLVICELFESGFLHRSALSSLHDAHKYLLSPLQGARVMPARVIIKCALLESESMYKRHFSQIAKGSDSIVSRTLQGRDEAYSTVRIKDFPDAKLRSEGSVVAVIDLNDFEALDSLLSTPQRLEVEMKTNEVGDYVHAVIQWFRIEIDEEAEFCIETVPSSAHGWEHAIYPLHPAKYVPGHVSNVVKVEFELSPCGLRMIRAVGSRDEDYNYKSREIMSLSKIPASCIVDEGYITRLHDKLYIVEWVHNVTEFCFQNIGDRFRLLYCLFISPTMDGMVILQEAQRHIQDFNLRNCKIFHMCSDDNKSKLDDLYWSGYNVHAKTLEQIIDTEIRWNVVVSSDIVAPNGMLSKKSLERHVLATRSLMNTDHETLVLPARVEVRAECWESDELLRLCQIVGPNVAGFDISSLLNPYSMSCLNDLEANFIPHRCLTSDFVVWDDVIAEYCRLNHSGSAGVEPGTLKVRASGSGRLDAVLFWFQFFREDSNKSISTRGSGDGGQRHRHHWNQAAFVFTRTDEKKRKVEKGDEIELKPVLHDGMILFHLISKGKNNENGQSVDSLLPRKRRRPVYLDDYV